jgi:hypothetical protein
VHYNTDTKDVTTEIEGCNFNNHSSRSEGRTSGLAGGALHIYHHGLQASNVKTVVATCVFRHTAQSSNQNIFGGTLVFNYHDVSGVTNLVSACQFLDSDSTAGTPVGYGEGSAVSVSVVGRTAMGRANVINVSTNITGTDS